MDILRRLRKLIILGLVFGVSTSANAIIVDEDIRFTASAPLTVYDADNDAFTIDNASGTMVRFLDSPVLNSSVLDGVFSLSANIGYSGSNSYPGASVHQTEHMTHNRFMGTALPVIIRSHEAVMINVLSLSAQPLRLHPSGQDAGYVRTALRNPWPRRTGDVVGHGTTILTSASKQVRREQPKKRPLRIRVDG